MSINFTFGQVKGLSRIADADDARFYVGCVHITQDGYAIVSNAATLLKTKIAGDVPAADTLGAGLKIEKLEQCAAIAKTSKALGVAFDVQPDNVENGRYPPYDAAYPNKDCTELVAQYQIDELINVLTAMKDALGAKKGQAGAKKGQAVVQFSIEQGKGMTKPTLLNAHSTDGEVEGLIVPCRG